MSHLNRVGFATSTTGTGTITVGAAETGYATPAEAGAVNAAVYEYVIEDGNDFEIGIGTYTSSGTTFSRDTVYLSKIGGSPGTTKLTLSGTAKVYFTATREFLDQAATTSVPGRVELTDGAEALGGSDADRAVTSAALASAQSKAAEGYITLPGGVIIQWGACAGSGAETFPTAFPTACAAVVTTSQMADRIAPVTTGPSTTGFTPATSVASTGGASGIGSLYIAIGY